MRAYWVPAYAGMTVVFKFPLGTRSPPLLRAMTPMLLHRPQEQRPPM